MDSPEHSQTTCNMNDRDLRMLTEVAKTTTPEGLGLRRTTLSTHTRLPATVENEVYQVQTSIASQIQSIQRQLLDGQPAPSGTHVLSAADLVGTGSVMMTTDQGLVAEIMHSGGVLKGGSTSPVYYGNQSRGSVGDTMVMTSVPVSQGYIQQAGSEDVRQTYEVTEELLNHPLNAELFAHAGSASHQDLTDEDRRLVSALVAVQMSQQQKQSNQVTSANELPVTSVSRSIVQTNMPTKHQYMHQKGVMYSNNNSNGQIAGIVVNRQRTVEENDEDNATLVQAALAIQNSQKSLGITAGKDHMLPLPPLKKVLSNQSRLADLQQQFEREKQESLKPDRMEEIVICEQLAIEDTSDELEVDSDLPEDGDSDYEPESDTRNSRRTLPHKKRISRKLKQPKKSRIHSKCYKCNKCGEQFANQQVYSMHKATAHNKNLFTCEICMKGFAQQLRFFEHLKAHYEAGMEAEIEDNSNEDTIIIDQTPEKQQLQVMNSVTIQKQTFYCEHCDKTFRREKAYRTHMQNFHVIIQDEQQNNQINLIQQIQIEEDPSMENATRKSKRNRSRNRMLPKMEIDIIHEELGLEGEIVETQMEDEVILEAEDFKEELHEIEVEGIDIEGNTCEFCGEDFNSKVRLITHLKKFHSDPRILPKRKKIGTKREMLTCPKCGRVFNHRNSLVYHLRSHTGERPHQCELCGKSFFASSALKVHMRLHSGEKPYKCEFCGRHFRQWGDLKYHCISIHTDERQYQCEFCGKDFARKYSLIVHRRIHTGERNYKCEFCGKCFRAASYLQNHRRIHTGEKPHPCSVCGKPFRVRSDMKRHMQTHNREASQVGAHNRNIMMVNAISASGSATGGVTQLTLATTNASNVPHDIATPQITIEESADTIITGDSLSQPMSLSIRSIDNHTPHLQAQTVQEEVLGYTREGLEPVAIREGNSNTLYVWPVFMN